MILSILHSHVTTHKTDAFNPSVPGLLSIIHLKQLSNTQVRTWIQQKSQFLSYNGLKKKKKSMKKSHSFHTELSKQQDIVFLDVPCAPWNSLWRGQSQQLGFSFFQITNSGAKFFSVFDGEVNAYTSASGGCLNMKEKDQNTLRSKNRQSQTWQKFWAEQERNPPHFGQGWDMEQTSLQLLEKQQKVKY